MVKKLLLLLCITAFFNAQGQDLEPSPLFSQAIAKNIKAYKAKCQIANLNRDFELAEALFDTLIQNVVINSTLDNFAARKVSGKKIALYDFEKPMYLMTYASWCTPGSGEIPALNSVAKEHYQEIDFVILFWDTKKSVRKIANEYSDKITVIYIDELENNHSKAIAAMKHSLGFPTSFFIDRDKKIVDVRRGVLHHYNEAYAVSYELNYTAFLNGISLLKVLQDKTGSIVID